MTSNEKIEESQRWLDKIKISDPLYIQNFRII